MTYDDKDDNFKATMYPSQGEYLSEVEQVEYNPQVEYDSHIDYSLDPTPEFPENGTLKDALKDTLATTTSVNDESVREGSVDPNNEKDGIDYEYEEIYMEHEHYSHTWANYTDEWNPNGLRKVEDGDIALRRVSGPVPKITYVLALVEFAERGSYYGLTNVISNFVQFPLPKGAMAGELPRRTLSLQLELSTRVFK